MRDDYQKFEDAGAKIVVVGKHSQDEMKKYWDQNSLPYIGIPDPNSNVSEIFRQQWKLLKLGLMPALFVVDKKGRIAFAHYSSGMSDIPQNDLVLKEVEKLKGQGEDDRD